MSNSIPEEYWSINGVSLHRYCWAVKTVGGSRYALPPMRGDNIQYPYRPGREFRKKIADSRVITLAMWVAGVDDNTDNPNTDEPVVQWNDNWQQLRQLFWSPEKELTLTRRWKLNTVSPTVVTAEAKCQISSTMEPQMTGRTRADFAVDLLLADPFFYGPEITVNVPIGEEISIFNPGDVPVAYRHFSVTLQGELVNPLIINHTANPEISFTANTIVPQDTTIAVDVGTYIAKRSFDGSNVSAAISHSGDRSWMKLLPGDNLIHLHSEGTGAATFKFRPAYL